LFDSLVNFAYGGASLEQIDRFSKRFDSTLLKATATVKESEVFIDDSISYGFRAIVVPWYLMDRVVRKVRGTDISAACGAGFPFGFETTETKAYMIRQSLRLGPEVRDIDITANISAMKSGDWDYFEREISYLSGLLKDVICKVIIEVSYLDAVEIEKACSILMKLPHVDFIKTGTGYGSRATTVEDVRIIKRVVGDEKGIKVSGGVKSLAQVEEFMAAGADIFGSSSAMAIYREFAEKYPGRTDLA